MTTKLNERAVLAQLNISQWTARKLDKKATKKTNREAGAADNVSRVYKALVPMESALDAVHTKSQEIRDFFLKNTLPWGVRGMNILPSENYFAFMGTYNQMADEWKSLVRTAVREYQQMTLNPARLQHLMGDLYNPADYPSWREVENKFSIDMAVFPVPSGDFRTEIADDELQRIANDVERRVQEAANTAMTELWTRLFEKVSNMATQLGKSDGRLFETLVDNIRELCPLLTRMNVMQDPNLELMRQEVERKLCKHDVDAFRSDKILRQEVANEASDIAKRMAVFMGAN